MFRRLRKISAPQQLSRKRTHERRFSLRNTYSLVHTWSARKEEKKNCWRLCFSSSPSSSPSCARSRWVAAHHFGDGGGAGGEVPGVRARAAAGPGGRGGHRRLGRPLPRRDGALLRDGQAPHLQRNNNGVFSRDPCLCIYISSPPGPRIARWSWWCLCLCAGIIWSVVFPRFRSSSCVLTQRRCNARAFFCCVFRRFRRVFFFWLLRVVNLDWRKGLAFLQEVNYKGRILNSGKLTIEPHAFRRSLALSSRDILDLRWFGFVWWLHGCDILGVFCFSEC